MTHKPGLPDYDERLKFPPRVWRAVENTRSGGFAQACLPEVGALLELCASLVGVNAACELGTAYGVGAAWIESGLRPGASLLTIEPDHVRATAARELFAESKSVETLEGDWTAALERRPVDLLFSDGGPKRNPGDPEKLLPLLCVGGLAVLDDYTPDRRESDPSINIWLDNPAYRARELRVSETASVILAVRVR